MNSALAGELLSPLLCAITLLGRSRRASHSCLCCCPCLCCWCCCCCCCCCWCAAAVAVAVVVSRTSAILGLHPTQDHFFLRLFSSGEFAARSSPFRFRNDTVSELMPSCHKKNTIFQVKIAISCGLMPFAPQEKMQSLFERLRFSLGS